MADEIGLDDLSMRRLAEALGVEAMSLYHHVPNKDAILDGMVDRVFAEIAHPDPALDWKRALHDRCASVREALLRHPWAIRVMESRAQAGPATLGHHDAVLGCLRAAGFSIPLAGHAYAVLDGFTYGFVMTELNLPFRSGEEAQAVAAKMFAQIPPGAFPHLIEFATERAMKPGYSYSDEFAFGLALILDGLERALAREHASGTKRARRH
jgi:AcrR family transcriptional regulator